MTSDTTGASAHAATITELLIQRAERTPDKLAFAFLDDDGGESTLTYAEIDRRARAIAQVLDERQLIGSPILLGMPAGLPFVSALFGCFYARCVAVPVALPRLGSRGDAERARLIGILRSFHGGAFLTTEAVLPFLEVARDIVGLDDLPPLIAVDEIDPARGERFHFVAPDPQEIAVLQFTSGSTSRPRGVIVRHSHIIANMQMQHRAYATSSADVFGGWLPHFHDMGLFGLIVHPVFIGAPSFLSSPVGFIRDPMSWLRSIDRHGLTISGAPSFAYALLNRRARDEQIEKLDLSSWRVAFDGSEPIQRETQRLFAKRFEPAGFSPSAFYPSYGLAEATLFVTAARDTELPRSRHLDRDALALGRAKDATLEEDSVEVVSCGRPVGPGTVRIVHPETHVEMPDGWVGEIWVSGPHVGGGYLDGGVASRETFRAQIEHGDGVDHLRTGDLGFVDRGELFVTGRMKDVIVVRGRNFYPHDLELTVADAVGLSPGRVVVVESTLPRAGVDVVLTGTKNTVELTERVRQALFSAHGIAALRVIPVEQLPRTSSGKKQRALVGRALAEGRIAVESASSIGGEA